MKDNIKLNCKFCLSSSPADENDQIAFKQIDETLESIVGIFFQDLITLGQTDWICYSCEEMLKSFFEFYSQTLENQNHLPDVVTVKLESAGSDEIVIENQTFKREVVEECCPEFIDFDGDLCSDDNQDGNHGKETVEKKPKRPPGRPPKARRGRKKKVLLGSQVLSAQSNSIETKPSNKWTKDDQCVNLINQFFQMICDVCPDTPTFNNYYDLKKHMTQLHRTTKVWTCCGKRLVKRSELVAHANEHINPYICKLCGHQEASQKLYKQHLNECRPKRCFECAHCPKSFTAKSYLRKHLLTLHFRTQNTVTEFMCEICARIFMKQYSLDQHLLYDHSDKPLTEQCPICGDIVSKRNYGLKAHIKLYHEDAGKIFPCPDCGKEFTKERTMSKHRTWYHTRGRVFVCGVCNKGFFTPKRLTEHEATHTGELIYKCPFCGFGFKSSGNYYAHLRRLHPIEFETIRKTKKKPGPDGLKQSKNV